MNFRLVFEFKIILNVRVFHLRFKRSRTPLSELINSLSILENLILKLARKYMVPQLMKKCIFGNVFETNSENHF